MYTGYSSITYLKNLAIHEDIRAENAVTLEHGPTGRVLE